MRRGDRIIYVDDDNKRRDGVYLDTAGTDRVRILTDKNKIKTVLRWNVERDITKEETK